MRKIVVIGALLTFLACSGETKQAETAEQPAVIEQLESQNLELGSEIETIQDKEAELEAALAELESIIEQ